MTCSVVEQCGGDGASVGMGAEGGDCEFEVGDAVTE